MWPIFSAYLNRFTRCFGLALTSSDPLFPTLFIHSYHSFSPQRSSHRLSLATHLSQRQTKAFKVNTVSSTEVLHPDTLKRVPGKGAQPSRMGGGRARRAGNNDNYNHNHFHCPQAIDSQVFYTIFSQIYLLRAFVPDLKKVKLGNQTLMYDFKLSKFLDDGHSLSIIIYSNIIII